MKAIGAGKSEEVVRAQVDRVRAQFDSTDGSQIWFEVERAKTGQTVIGTLSKRAASLLRAYRARLAVDFHPTAPIFRTRGHEP